MTTPELKKFNDDQLNELSTDFVLKNLEDRDDVIFDFEADIKKVLKKINVRRFLNKDRKYVKKVKQFIKDIILQRYLVDMIKVGTKKANRFKRTYINV